MWWFESKQQHDNTVMVIEKLDKLPWGEENLIKREREREYLLREFIGGILSDEAIHWHPLRSEKTVRYRSVSEDHLASNSSGTHSERRAEVLPG